MSLAITILGCGSSGGVPRIGGDWGACDPSNPKNRRRRCSILVERLDKVGGGRTSLLVDTSPDIRDQLLGTGTRTLDGVLFTHDHADHVHGIDDLRVVARNGGRRVDVYYDERTGRTLNKRFAYCFETAAASSYPPILSGQIIWPMHPVSIEGAGGTIHAVPFEQDHGDAPSLGFRFGGIAYSSDLMDLPERSLEALKDLEVWIIDALRYSHHPTHFSVDDALKWIDRVQPKRAVITNMHVDLDYETLKRELPENIEPAYDGMVLETACELPAHLSETV